MTPQNQMDAFMDLFTGRQTGVSNVPPLEDNTLWWYLMMWRAVGLPGD